jgi:hypothetical protein
LDGPVSSVEVTFSEPIGSFPLDQVTITGPIGNAIEPTSVTTTDDLTWTVTFAPQGLPGVYRLELGPQILDAAPQANPMNQDGDWINGETSDTYQGSFAIAAAPVNSYPFLEDFEAGAIGGLGAYWGFETQGTGRVQVTAGQNPRGSYQLELSQTDYGTNHAAAILHLDLLDGVTPASGVTVDFYEKVFGSSSGQLARLYVRASSEDEWTYLINLGEATDFTHYTLDLDQIITEKALSYSDDFQLRFYQDGDYDNRGFVFDDIQVMTSGEDLFGAQVISQTPTETLDGPVSSVEVTFSEPIGSFPLDQVTITGPIGNAIEPTSVTTTDDLTWTVTFAPQGLPGVYRLELGPQILDAAPQANPMNQDGDWINGETSDTYLGSFAIAVEPANSFPFLEDFETGSIGGLGGYWGFETQGTGRVQVTAGQNPRGSYQLELSQTDYGTNHAAAILHLDLLDGVTPASGVTVDFYEKVFGSSSGQLARLYVRASSEDEWTYLINLGEATDFTHYTLDLDQIITEKALSYSDDFQLRFYQDGDYDNRGFVFDDIQVMTSGEDLFGAQVISQTPTETLDGPVSSVEVTFSEPIGSFPLDQVTITGPIGNAIEPTSVTTTDDLTWTVTFAPQGLPGVYRLELGPQILDAAPQANPMNQDGDWINGENSDTYLGSFAIAVEPANSFPFLEDFEAGSIGGLGAYWGFETQGTGQVQVTTGQNPRGSYQLELSQTDYGINHAAAILHLDLLDGVTPASGVTLDFYEKVFGSGSSNYAALYLRSSSEDTWTHITSLGEATDFTHYTMDLDQIIVDKGLSYSDDFQLRFYQDGDYDNRGFVFDDIQVMTSGEDLFGAQVISQTPTETLDGPVSSVEVTFSEPIGSFPLDQVTITGPIGNAIEPTSVTTTDDLTWTVTFAPQGLPGVYRLELGPQILDAAPQANPMNQDGDWINGENSDTYLGSFAIAVEPANSFPFLEDFETGSIGGLGGYWGFETQGSGRVRITDAANPRGTYQLELSQTDYGTNHAAAILHLDLLDGVTPASGVTVDFYEKVFGSSSGQLARLYVRASSEDEWTYLINLSEATDFIHYTLDLDQIIVDKGLSYSDDFQLRFYQDGDYDNRGFVFDDIQVMTSGEDLFGAQVISQTPTETLDGPVSSVEVTFSEPIGSFPLDQVTITGPIGNAIEPTSVTTTDDLTWTVTFAPQGLPGVYRLELGPQILDAAPQANPMNQDGDWINGETSDTYLGSFAIAAAPLNSYPFLENFEAGAIGGLGAYWSFETQGSGRVRITDAANPRGTYQLELSQTDYGTNHAAAILHLDLLDGVTPASGVTVDFYEKVFGSSSGQLARLYVRASSEDEWTYLINLSEATDFIHYTLDLDQIIVDKGLSYSDDFQLRFYQDGDYDNRGFVFDDIQVMTSGEDLFGAQVISQTPTETLDGPVSSVEVTFSEPIGSFPLDQVTITGPIGNAIEPTSVTTTDDLTWTVTFAPQGLPGVYRLELGPQILDAAPQANPMNQDGDWINGETSDTYLGSFAIAAAPLNSYPFLENFEAGAIGGLGAYWSFETQGSGRVRITDAANPRGTYQLELSQTEYGTNHAAAILHLDLLDGVTPASGVTVDFYEKVFGSAYSQYARLYVRASSEDTWTFVTNLTESTEFHALRAGSGSNHHGKGAELQQ